MVLDLGRTKNLHQPLPAFSNFTLSERVIVNYSNLSQRDGGAEH